MKKNRTVGGYRYPILRKILMTMRLTMFLILISFAQANAGQIHSESSKLTLKIRNSSIENVLFEIEKKTDYVFVYSKDLIDVNRIVDVDVKEQNIEAVLSTIFSGQDVRFQNVNNNIIISPKFGLPQGKLTITGKVIEKNGDPLPGVNVYEKSDPSHGVITSVDGTYSITVSSADAILVCSFVGFEAQELHIANRKVINVTLLESSITLDEVISVAYGTQKKSNLTAAVDQISGSKVQNRPLRSISDGLQGEVAGLNVIAPSGAPEASPKLNIRGFTGFGTSSSPLILVDGVQRNIADINPNDVESISVLKDGAASAIYGSRAPFGVVLIKTKQGFAELINEARRNAGKSSRFGDLQIKRMKAWAAGDYTNNVFDGINPEEVPYGTYKVNDKKWGGYWEAFANTDWFDVSMKDVVPSQEYNMNISGGSNNTSYYLGLGYNESNGIFKGVNDHKNRYTAIVNVNTEITSWLSANAKLDYVRTDEIGPNNRGSGRNYGRIWNELARSFPILPTHNPNGSYYFASVQPNYNGDAGTEGVVRDDITLTGGVVITPFKGLNINGRYTWRNNSRDYSRTTFVLMQVLPDGSEVPTERTTGHSAVKRQFSRNDYYTFDVNADYSKTFSGKHNLHILAGIQQENNDYIHLFGEGKNLYSIEVPTIKTTTSDYKASDKLSDWATRGYYGRLSYNYSEKYFIEFNVRHDAHSKFKSDNRWGTFPSVSAGWNVARENFWTIDNIISRFKIRGSYSTSGSLPDGNYLFYPTINTGISSSVIINGEFVNYASQPQLVSNTLTWAKPSTIDVGLDIAAFGNRLDFSYDWYQRTIRDQFGPAKPLPEVLGTSVPRENNAVSETRGWEFTLKWRDRAFNLVNKPFRYNVAFRMSDYIGYVVEYKDNVTGSRNGQWTPGEVFGQNYYYTSNGIMQNVDDLYANPLQGGDWYYSGDLAMQDTNGDGTINSGNGGVWYALGDKKKSGFNYPRKKYSITLGIEWNGFDLSALFDGVGQWNKYSSSMYVWGNQGNEWFAPYFKESADLGYWRPDNTDAFFPRNTLKGKNRNRSNAQYELNLANLRVKNLRLGYGLPKRVAGKIGLDNLYVYFSAENLGFIYYKSYIKYDPQLMAASSGQGYPPQRILSFGINIGL